MQVGSALGRTLFLTLNWIFELIIWLVFIWVIISWFVFFAAQTSFRWRYRTFFNILVQLDQLLSRAASPLLRPFRKLLPAYKTGGIDWSPMLLLLTIYIVRTLIVQLFGPILF